MSFRAAGGARRLSIAVHADDNGRLHDASLCVGPITYDCSPDPDMTSFADFPSVIKNEANEWQLCISDNPAMTEKEAQDLDWFCNKRDSIACQTDSVVQVSEDGQCQAVNLHNQDFVVNRGGGGSSSKSSGDITKVGSFVPSLLLLGCLPPGGSGGKRRLVRMQQRLRLTTNGHYY